MTDDRVAYETQRAHDPRQPHRDARQSRAGRAGETTTVDKAKAGRKLADDLRAIQALPTGITAVTLEPVIKKLDLEEGADAKKISDDLKALQAQTGGISPYHLDAIVLEADEMAKGLQEAAPTGEAPTVVDVPYLEQQGAILNCTMGNWNGEPGAYSYQWMADGAVVGVGTGLNTHDLTVADVGKSFTCTVTATNGFGSTTAPPSNAVVVAGAAA